MRLIPSGIFAAKEGAVIGNGVVINPEVMFGELSRLIIDLIKGRSTSVSNYFSMEAFDYDDIQLVPNKGIIKSRKEADTSVKFGNRFRNNIFFYKLINKLVFIVFNPNGD